MDEKKLGLFDSLKLSNFYLLYLLGYVILVSISLFTSKNNLTIDIFFEKVFVPAVTAALLEELIFRYLIQRELIKKYGRGILKKELLMILISSAIFGLSHLINIFYGEPVLYVLIQSIGTIAAGFFFGVFYYKTNRFLYCVGFHFVYDFLLLLGAVSEETTGTVVSILSVILSALTVLILVLGTFAMVYSKNGKQIFENEKKSKILYICSCIIVVVYFILPFI